MEKPTDLALCLQALLLDFELKKVLLEECEQPNLTSSFDGLLSLGSHLSVTFWYLRALKAPFADLRTLIQAECVWTPLQGELWRLYQGVLRVPISPS